MTQEEITDKMRELEARIKKNIAELGKCYRMNKHNPELGLFEEMQFLRRLRNHIEAELKDCEMVEDNPAEYTR